MKYEQVEVVYRQVFAGTWTVLGGTAGSETRHKEASSICAGTHKTDLSWGPD